MLTDNMGRTFRYLRLSVTEVCNFRCQYCLPDGYQGKPETAFLSLAEIETLVSAFAALGTTKVRVTGGEPSLRRDLPEILSRIHHTAGIEQLAITTHGARLEKYARQWQQAGLDQVNVSIDSLDPRQFHAITGKDCLSAVLRGLDAALDCGLTVKVNTVLMAGFSVSQLKPFLHWLKNTPITLRFIELMQTGDHTLFFNKNRLSGEPLKQWLEQQGWQQVQRRRDAGPALEYAHPDYVGRIGVILPYARDFCQGCNRLRVAANGKLHLCLFSEEGISLRPHLANGDVDAVMTQLTELLGKKQETHSLHEGKTGATRHLAMLGG
ncbi:GTP 3',8-cyclase MoaA [Alteromonas sp. CYL-A6]|uniref:GTP 3',8-cyclase MoaA n=1 Tax=Alteromonas nitratireducens TaxID=3390813 RepID=UPI0034B9F463